MLTALSLLPFHSIVHARNIVLAPAIKIFVSCIKVLQSCDAVMDIHCIVSAAFMATNDSYEYDLDN